MCKAPIMITIKYWFKKIKRYIILMSRKTQIVRCQFSMIYKFDRPIESFVVEMDKF